MTLSEISKSGFKLGSRREACDQCGGPLAERPAHPYPVLEQTLFGLSFLGFLLVGEKLRGQLALIWVWSAVQLILGALLIRGRMRSKRTVYRCIRCGRELR